MYDTINLYDGSTAKIKSSDLIRLESVLEKINAKINDFGNSMSIEKLTFNAGIAIAQVFEEEKLPIYDSGLINPMRCLGYQGIGGFYASVESIRDEQREIFKSTQNYFRDIFLIQESTVLENQRDKPDIEYLNQLNENLNRIVKDFPEQMTKQTDAFDELVDWLDIPDDRVLM